MTQESGITQWFGENLAILLSEKILAVAESFDAKSYIETIRKSYVPLSYSQRIELHADQLRKFLPKSYQEVIFILVQTLGEENPNETGMFKEYYWIMPIGKLVEKYGLEHFEESMKAIEEITKRNTGEYAIRPFIGKYPEATIKVMKNWAQSSNFHLRRLSAEGSRPKLPWSTKLDTFIEKPEPVFEILEILKEDSVKFVQKSVANNLADYLKVNPPPALELINQWSSSNNKHTQWIIQHATRASRKKK